MKQKIINIVLSILIVLSFGFSLYVFIDNKDDTDLNNTQYVMYIGTNDKDTYSQIIPLVEAKEIIDGICFKYLDGYTIQDATGTWVDEKDEVTKEDTLICYFYGTSEDVIYKIADEIIAALNQNTVLIEKDLVTTEYYSGK